MEAFGLILHGFEIALQPTNLLYCLVGTFLGTVVGVLPGIGPTAAMGILLPLTFTLDPIPSIIMLAGIVYGAMYGGSTTSILLNIPGEATSVVSCLDGYMMARQGRAGPALGIAAFGSFIAGTLSLVGLMFLAPSLANYALRFGPPEYVMVYIMGLTIVTYLARESMLKALIMAVLGIFVGSIGLDPVSGARRFTFRIPEFYDGIGIVPIVMGLFGIAEVLNNVGERIQGEIFTGKIQGLLPTVKDWRESTAPIMRGTVLGFFMGILPGVGNIVPVFLSYALEKKISKHPERFGTGEIAGLAGPESCNNAAVEATFVPLLAMGIPTTSMSALLLAALMIYGLQPGPLLMQNSPDLFWGVVASMYIGNVMLLVLNLPLIPLWVKLLKVPYSYLFCMILLFVCIGAYSINYNVMDIYLTIFFGVAGYFLIKFGYEPATFILALILGPLIEIDLRRSLIVSNGDFMIFLKRPLSAILLGIVLAIIILPLFTKKRLGEGLEKGT
jgi:putative tricarboxylic transport membrane protein